MNNISVSELKENTFFDKPVFLDEAYILLSPDTQVSAELIERLQRWRFDTVATDGSAKDASAYATTADTEVGTAVLEMDIKEKQQFESAKKTYYNIITFIRESLASVRDTGKMDMGLLTGRVKELISMIKNNRDTMLRYMEFPYPADDYLPQHSVNTAVLTLAMGDLLKLPPHRLIEIGSASLLHDLGMVKIPAQIYQSSKILTQKEKQMIVAHTALGYRLLKSFSASEDIALAALEHHERYDGSGYPRSLKADKTTLYGRIIAVACSYDAMTSKRPFKNALDGHHALLELLKARQKLYDEKMIRALVFSISLFPLGSTVYLNNGALAKVVKADPVNPKYPVVQLILDAEGKQLNGQHLVTTSADLSVQRCLSHDELPK